MSNYRQIITYHPTLGHLYVPNQKVRVKYGSDAYFLESDHLGFRNSKNKPKGKFKLLVLGDSYTAGDGVCNEDRFTDLLAKQFDLEVINLAVNGYGVDQQVLVYETYKDQIDHDAVLFIPHLDDFFRNMKSAREGKNRSGESIEIPKPYFELVNGELALRNQPVPRERNVTQSSQAANGTAVDSSLNSLKNKTKHLVNRLAGKQLVGNVSYPELNDINSKEWALGKALIAKLVELTGDKPLVMAVFPDNYVLSQNEPQYYHQAFKSFESDRVSYLNLQEGLYTGFKSTQTDFFLPLCGHYTPYAHTTVANVLSESLASKFAWDKRTIDNLASNGNQKNKYVLGISCFYHDSAAALLKDGVIIAAAQEERFTRKKHDPGFPSNAIHYCLEEAHISIHDLEAVCFYDSPAMTVERVLQNATVLDDPNAYWAMAGKSMYRKLLLPDLLKQYFDYSGKVYRTEHHASHAASAFYPSPHDDAAILVMDGVGEWACSTIAHGRGSKIEILKQQHYPHSIGLLYSAFTYYCGFKVNSGEYKLMGLAPYGKPKYADLIKEKVVRVNEDGSVVLNLDLFDFMKGEAMTNAAFDTVMGGPRREGETQITQREMDLAASIQVVTEEVVLKMARYARELTGSKYLTLAGGVALNCVANGKLLREGVFDDIWIQPASGDAGGAPGAALEYYYHYLHAGESKAKNSTQTHSNLGPKFSDDEVLAYLETNGFAYHKFDHDKREEQLGRFIADSKIIGHLDGRMEFGPRALGNRSIIGNPTDPEMQKKFNLKIKYRESFRPFAPIALEESLSDYFDIDRPSPFMLLVAPVKKELRREVEDLSETEDMIQMVNQIRSELPSITHVDYSARLQSVNGTDNENPAFHRLLLEAKKNSGYGVLINTSFNVRGEPIVCTPEDAYRCFMRTEMDVLVLGNYYLIKEEQPNWEEKENWQETFELD